MPRGAGGRDGGGWYVCTVGGRGAWGGGAAGAMRPTMCVVRVGGCRGTLVRVTVCECVCTARPRDAVVTRDGLDGEPRRAIPIASPTPRDESRHRRVTAASAARDSPSLSDTT